MGALEHSTLLLDKAPALFQAAQVFADPNVRHSATVGGNICNASPSADSAPSLLAFDAHVVIARFPLWMINFIFATFHTLI